MPATPSQPPPQGRLARVFGLDGNPLRRGSDRAEAWIRVGLLAVFLIAAPMAALTAGGWAGQMRTTEISARTAPVHTVRAVLLQRAPATAGPVPADWGGQVWVRARWQTAGAPDRTGDVLAPEGSPAGTVVTVWLDASGHVTSPPPEPGQAANEATVAALIAPAVVALAVLVVLRLTQRLLNWRRLAAWEAAWSDIGPRWTGHRS
jgi:hypothetical protein